MGDDIHSAKKRQKKAFEPEEHFILRVPPSLADKIRQMIRNAGSKEVAIGDLKFGVGAPGSGRGDGTGNGNDAAAVVTEEDAEEQRRRGQLTFNNEQYNAKLVDLPCIVEAYKSLDRHQYFKAGDIGQMIVVQDPDEREPPTKYPSGLTPSTKNIRKHWEKRRIKMKKSDIQRMEDTFMALMEEDNEDVRYEVISEDEEEEEPRATTPAMYTPQVSTPRVTTPAISTPSTSTTTTTTTATTARPTTSYYAQQQQQQQQQQQYQQQQLMRAPTTPATSVTSATTPHTMDVMSDRMSAAESASVMDEDLEEDIGDSASAAIRSTTEGTGREEEEGTDYGDVEEALLAHAAAAEEASTTMSTPATSSAPTPTPPDQLMQQIRQQRMMDPQYIAWSAEVAALDSEINSMRAKIEERRANASKIPNPILRGRLEKEIDGLEAQLRISMEKRQALETTMSDFVNQQW